MTRDGRQWPKPANFDAMTEAYASGDVVAIAREKATYNAQLVAEGFPPLYDVMDDHTEPLRGKDQP